jgi:hypothetical protein
MAGQVVLLTVLSGRYGFHRDELYFIAAGKRPAWGYVDQPPVTPLVARAATAIFGETPAGLRVPVTLLGAATVLLVALAGRELGGGRGAQILAAVATALSAFVLVASHMVSTTSFDLLIWTAIGVLTLRLLRTGDGRWWLGIGAVVGAGMATKWLVLLLVAALGAAVLAVGPRQVLRTWWLAAGIGVGLAIAAPFVVWQATHGWPQLTVASGISGKDGAENRIMFVPQHLIYLSPALVPVWVAGLVRLWRDPGLRWARSIALAYPLLCAATFVLGGKGYYSVPLQLLLIAAGAEPTVRWLRDRTAWRVVAAAVTVPAVVISLLVGLPTLPADQLRGFVEAVNKEQGEQVGWPRFVDTMAVAWQQIPADKRATSVIFTRNYGQAGAVEHFGPERGLPAPHSGHMSYADWGPPDDGMTGQVLVVGGFVKYPTAQRSLAGCRTVTVVDNGIGLDNDEQGTPIALCDGTTGPWSRIWPDLRHFY